MSFLRHREIYQVETGGRGRNRGYARTSRLDESPVGYSLAGCSPAEPASASPTGGTLQQWRGALQLAIRCFLKTTLSRGLTLGAHPSYASLRDQYDARRRLPNGALPMSTHSYSRCWLHVIWETLRHEPMLDKRA